MACTCGRLGRTASVGGSLVTSTDGWPVMVGSSHQADGYFWRFSQQPGRETGFFSSTVQFTGEENSRENVQVISPFLLKIICGFLFVVFFLVFFFFLFPGPPRPPPTSPHLASPPFHALFNCVSLTWSVDS